MLRYLVLLLLVSPAAHAWEKHQSLMTMILAGVPGSAGIDKPLYPPCPADDVAMYQKLASELQLNPKVALPPTAQSACERKQPITGREILSGSTAPAAEWHPVDEPDHGIDQDLPGPVESFDPQGAAKWMGGTTGRTSTGFRHMFFGGVQLWHPINTFQIPTRAIGYAPERAALMARKARELIQKGSGPEAAWGYRVLGWSMHYLQDLSQPFHAVQLPSLSMVPWYALLKWPPGEAFGDLVRETTRTISNYHWAFEHYTYHRLTTQAGEGAGREPIAAYTECLREPDVQAVLGQDPRRDEAARDPLLLAERVARASVQLGPEVGAGNMRFFGTSLKDRAVDIPKGLGEPDYAEMTLRPDLVTAREQLGRVTCRALADASLASRMVLAWVLAP